MKGTPQVITISTNTIVKAILLLLFTAGLYVLRDTVVIILTAVVIASAIEPATRWFQAHFVPRVAGVIIIYMSVAIALSMLVYFILPQLVGEVSALIQEAPGYIDSLGESTTASESFFSREISPRISFPELLATVEDRLNNVSESLINFTSLIFGGLLSFILIIIISFYLAVQENGISNFLRVVTPFKYEVYVIDLWRRSQYKIGRWIQGQLLLSLIVGVLVYVGLLIFKVPNALVLAIIASIFELIPLFGPILASIPAIAIGFTEGGIGLGFTVIGLYVVIQQFENHLLVPLVVEKVVGVPALIVIVSLLIGSQLLGFLGLILAVPMAAVVMEYVSDINTRKGEQNRRHQEEIATQQEGHVV